MFTLPEHPPGGRAEAGGRRSCKAPGAVEGEPCRRTGWPPTAGTTGTTCLNPLLMALARKIVSGEEEDETETVESVFAQAWVAARDAEASAEEYLVDDDWKAVEIRPAGGPIGTQVQRLNGRSQRHGRPTETRGRPDDGIVSGEGRRSSSSCPGNGHARNTGRTAIEPEAIAVNGNGANGNGRLDDEAEERSRSSRCSPGRSSWPKSRSSRRAGAARPRPRHCPSSSGRWNRSGRKSRSARGARPQGHRGKGVATSAMASPCTAMYAAFFAFQDLVVAGLFTR